MPELEALIQRWKTELTMAFGGDAEIVAELESHLREEIENQIRAGQPPVAALAAARTKLGTPVRLAAEYARVASPTRWLPVFVLAAIPVLMVAFFIVVTIATPTLLKKGALLLFHAGALWTGYSLALYVCLLGFCYVACWLVRPIGLGQRRQLGRALNVANAGAALLLLAGISLGSVRAKEHMGSFWNNDPREIGALVSCVWFAGLSILGCLLPGRQHRWVLLSLVGVSLCICGCVGPELIGEYRHLGGFPWSMQAACLVAATTLTPSAIACLGFFPPGQLKLRTPAATR